MSTKLDFTQTINYLQTMRVIDPGVAKLLQTWQTFLMSLVWSNKLITNPDGSNAISDIDNLTERNGKILLAENKKYDLIDGSIRLPWAQKRAQIQLNSGFDNDIDFALVATPQYNLNPQPDDILFVTTYREILEQHIYKPSIFNMHETTRLEYNIVANQFFDGKISNLMDGFEN